MWAKVPGGDEELFSNEEFDRLQSVRTVLTEYYPHAKEAILALEVLSRKRSERAVYELRDTLDHISIALRSETSPADAKRHLAECHTHLRRAAIEPYEWMAEKKFLEIESLSVKGKWVYRFLCIRKPDGYEMVDDLGGIAKEIIAGRNSKGASESLTHMREAVRLADASLKRLRPKEFSERLYGLGLAAIFTVVGVVLTLLAEAAVHWIAHLFAAHSSPI